MRPLRNEGRFAVFMIRGARRSYDPRRWWSPFVLERLARVNNPSQRHLFSSFAEYAAMHKDGDLTAAELARLRMEDLYRLRGQIPSAMIYMLGWWIDCHVPAAVSGCRRIVDLYRKRLQPEAQFDFPPSFYLEYVENAWISGTEGDCSQERITALKLLRKGASYPPRIRYIGGQFKTCSEVGGEAQRIAWLIIVLHELGSYPGRKMLRPPCERISILTADCSKTIMSAVRTKGPKELHCLTTAFLYWSAKTLPAVFMFLKRISPAFLAAAENMKLECLSKPVCSHPADVPVNTSARSAYEIFGDALKIGKKIPVWVQRSGIADADFDAIYAAGASAMPLSRSGALGAGMSEKSIGILTRAFSTKSSAVRALESISVHDRARLYVYLLARETRKSVKLTCASSSVARAQAEVCLRRRGSPNMIALVCVSCGTWREKSKCVAGVSKATSGVVADMGSSRFACNACSADWSVFRVNLVGAVLTSKIRMTTSPVSIMACVGCGLPASPFAVIGIFPYCRQCSTAKTHASKTNPRCLICKDDIKASARVCRINCYSRSSRERVAVTLCGQHYQSVKQQLPSLSVEEIVSGHGTRRSNYSKKGRVRIRQSFNRRRNCGRWDEGMDFK